MGSSHLVTGSHSSLEFDLLEQPDPGALVQVIANLREPRTTIGGINLAAGFRPSFLEAHGTEGAASGSHGCASRERGVDGYTMSLLQRLDLVSYFDGVADGYSLVHGEPTPDVFIFAAGLVNTPTPDCLGIEDATAGAMEKTVNTCKGARLRIHSMCLESGTGTTLPQNRPV